LCFFNNPDDAGSIRDPIKKALAGLW